MKSLQITCLLFICSINAYCQLELPKLISDGMVLQREIPLKIWGWSKSKDTIEIKFNNSNYQAIADNTGNWATTLPPIEAGGPFQMTISSSDSSVTIEDILIGDVWLCSGQSNMEISLTEQAPYIQRRSKMQISITSDTLKYPKHIILRRLKNVLKADNGRKPPLKPS